MHVAAPEQAARPHDATLVAAQQTVDATVWFVSPAESAKVAHAHGRA
jgi:hypothetical protein